MGEGRREWERVRVQGAGQMGHVGWPDDGWYREGGVRCRGIERVWREDIGRMSGGCWEDDREGGERVREDRQRVGGEGSRQQ